MTLHSPSSNPEFKAVITQLVEQFRPRGIIETGTNDGRGSTSVFAEFGIPMWTAEICPSLAVDAREHMKKKNWEHVQLLEGMTLNKERSEHALNWTLEQEYPDFVKIDGAQRACGSRGFYERELCLGAEHEENLLGKMFIMVGDNALVFLDSCGGIGIGEFLETIWMGTFPMTLVLDDCDHVKHYHSVKLLAQHGVRVHQFVGYRCAWARMEERPDIDHELKEVW